MNARYTKNGKLRWVKNLNWLQRRAGRVTRFEFVADDVGNEMKAFLDDGAVFECEWVDKNLMFEWSNRRCFRNAVKTLIKH